MNKSLPTGTVTFLFTDIEGSTKLAQGYPDTWETLRKHHDIILRNAIESQNGFVFRIVGDAFCAAFPTAGDALQAALIAQTDLNAKNWEGPPIKVRMGIHTGQADIQPDGEYLGYLTLTRVQRVMSTAHGGQVLLSNTAAELVRDKLPAQVSLRDMGEHRLKGLDGGERLWQVVSPDLPENFPALLTLRETPHNLPVQFTSFVGREKELEEIKQELTRQRLITLTGPGGVGKTRLSLHIASDLMKEFQHGAWFVEMEHVTDPGLMQSAIAHALNIQEVPGRRIADALKDYLREKELLLILDNFEQVIEAAPLVKQLLMEAERLKLIVTSRTPLRVAGEYEYRVPLLALPGEERNLDIDRLAQLESIQLFVERAKSARADFALTADNAPAIAETCRRLDGLPLAIELAAARIRVLPPQKIPGQLENRLTFLTSTARDLPVRQQTLRAAIGWSYDLLTSPEKLLFQRLAVFEGGSTLEAIAFVCDVQDELDLLADLESLLDKSLIRLAEEDGEARYSMLETIRDFADEALMASGEAADIQRRHLTYFHQLAQNAEPNLVGQDELLWIGRLTKEHHNLQAAVVWGLRHDLEKAVELICDLTLFWSRGGHNEEAIGWLELTLSDPTLEDSEPDSLRQRKLRARALLSLGILSLQQEYPAARSTLQETVVRLRELGEQADLSAALSFLGFLGDLEAAEESVSIARALDNKWILAYALAWQSQALRLAGVNLPSARTAAAESTRLSRQIRSDWAVARSLLSQGQLAVVSGEFDEARTYLQESLVLFTQSQDNYHANLARTELANVEQGQGNHEEALKLYQASIRVWHELGLQAAIAQQLEYIGLIAAAGLSYQHAVRLAGAANRLRDQTGTQPLPKEQAELQERLTLVRRELQDRLYNSLLAEGQSMTVGEAVQYAAGLRTIQNGLS